LLVAALAALALAVSAPPAAAKTPCWRQVINDWVDNERIDKTYPLHCYQDAIRHVPNDLRQYSRIEEDILAARQQLVRSNAVRRLNVHQPTSGKKAGTNPRARAVAPSQAKDPQRGLFKQALGQVGPDRADSVPLPLLILAGLALLLISAGAAGLISRRLRARRI
jgi:hypothetical protein